MTVYVSVIVGVLCAVTPALQGTEPAPQKDAVGSWQVRLQAAAALVERIVPPQGDPAQDAQHEVAAYSGRQMFKILDADRSPVKAKLAGKLAKEGRNAIPVFAAAATDGQVVADIGCGSGQFSLTLARAVGKEGRVYCRDISSFQINRLKKAVAATKLENLDIAVSKQKDVGIPENTIDLALLSDVFQYVITQKATAGFCKSLYAAMKPGGIVVVTYVRSSRLFHDREWRHDYDATLKAFAEQGFETGMRYVIEDEKRPAIVVEFRRPSGQK